MTDLFDTLSHNGEAKIGVDGSQHQRETDQGSIRWEDAKNQGITFMIWRSVLRGWRNDPTCIPNLVRAAEVGIPWRGIYVVLDANESLSAHMRLIEQVWRDIEREFGSDEHMPRIWLDDEVRGREVRIKIKKKKFDWVYKKFSPQRINDLHDQVSKEVYEMQGGEEPGYYSFPDFVITSKGTIQQRGYLTKKHEGMRWLAFYYNSWVTAMNEKAMPTKWVPPEWRDLTRVDKGIDVYQFGSELNNNMLGSVLGGDSDDFDINKAFKTDAEMNKMFHVGWDGEVVPLPVPPPSRFPLTDFDGLLLEDAVRENRSAINELAER